jgi:hypothetical protein
MVEAKLNEQDDPFMVKPTVDGFLSNSERAQQTLGQLTSYATAHLAAQFRTHIFSILFSPPSRPGSCDGTALGLLSAIVYC